MAKEVEERGEGRGRGGGGGRLFGGRFFFKTPLGKPPKKKGMRVLVRHLLTCDC